MEFNKLVFAGLSVGCLAAAAGGSYLAVRQNQAPVASERATDTPASLASPGSPASPAVTESEGVITPDVTKPAPSIAEPVSPSRPAPRVVNRQTRQADARSSERPSRSTPADVGDASVSSRPGQATEPAAPSAAANGGTMWETRPSVTPSTPEYRDPDPPALSERPRESNGPPPAPEYVDLTVPSDAVLGLQIERTVTSELARIEDRVEARVTRDVRVADRIAIPAGSTVRGSVTEVDRGGRVKGKSRLAIRFHTIVLADGSQLALKTDPVVREGQSPGGESAAKVGGAAIGGAILGAILGGGKGAAIGGAVGAAGGTAAAMSNDRNPATLSAGTTVTVRMQAPVTVTVQKN